MERELTAAKRRNRWLLGVGALLLVGCMAHGNSKTISAQRFECWDEQGRTRFVLEAFLGGPALGLYDENDKPRILLAVNKDRASLILCDADGRSRVGVGVAEYGLPLLCLLEGNGKSIWSAP